MPKTAIPAWQRAAAPQTDDPAAAEESDKKKQSDDKTPDPESKATTASKDSASGDDNNDDNDYKDDTEDDDVIAHGISSSDDAGADPEPSGPEGVKDLMDIARRFLQDDTVKGAPREKKIAFLVSKGVDHDMSETLVDELTTEEDAVVLSKFGVCRTLFLITSFG